MSDLKQNPSEWRQVPWPLAVGSRPLGALEGHGGGRFVYAISSLEDEVYTGWCEGGVVLSVRSMSALSECSRFMRWAWIAEGEFDPAWLPEVVRWRP